ncbi:MAG TPA: DUF3999 family protein [Caldithrix abyssi]|uniref:DUF3999 family protein n=1 Tax=Caldithrix abyssi TaxID=187145 RepID=A0A7V5RNA3_CALAY|nr:DUF3999 family protein [Caldithrix abyssi]
MKVMNKKLLFVVLLAALSAQGREYQYKRSLPGALPGWHKVILPDGIFGKIRQDMADVRILGVAANGDTVEAPYILLISRGRRAEHELTFKTINRSHNKKGYFYTFENDAGQTINQITPRFKTTDFDWRIRLEGSHDQREWFTLTRDYRILSLKNKGTFFKYTDIAFPESDFRYFRLFIPAATDPGLISARLFREESSPGIFRGYSLHSLQIRQEQRARQTTVEAELNLSLPVSYLKLTPGDSLDYYRPLTVKYLADSFNTGQGWKYRYRRLVGGILDSRKENVFIFPAVTAKKLKIIINNGDNPPLHVISAEVKGYIYTLITRVTQAADYYLCYGRADARRPSYDIARFKENIPDSLDTLTPGEERALPKKEEKSPALFENSAWLWLALGLIMVLLGWFSVKMMRGA